MPADTWLEFKRVSNRRSSPAPVGLSNRGALFAGVFAEYSTLIISTAAPYFSGGHRRFGWRIRYAYVIGTGSLWHATAPSVGNGGASNASSFAMAQRCKSLGALIGKVATAPL
jgi:hypothetical protein